MTRKASEATGNILFFAIPIGFAIGGYKIGKKHPKSWGFVGLVLGVFTSLYMFLGIFTGSRWSQWTISSDKEASGLPKKA